MKNLRAIAKNMRLVSVVLAAAILGACSSLGGEVGDIQKTWQGAIVRVPWSDDRITVNDLRDLTDLQPSSFPVVVHLHGCTDITVLEENFGQMLATEGLVFIAPDSMARDYRPLQCDPRTNTGGFNRFVFDFRMAEVSYALQQLQTMEWVDHDNLFLMGVSEGGVAAALYRGGEFKARVVSNWTCHGEPIVAGIAETAEPMLAIVNSQDPWYDDEHTHGQTGDCGAFFRHPDQSQSLVYDLPGVHSLFARPAVRRAIVNFLIQQTK